LYEYEITSPTLKQEENRFSDLKLKAVSTSETSVNVWQTTRLYNPEDSHRHFRCRENLEQN
jgi:hypothetical protein